VHREETKEADLPSKKEIETVRKQPIKLNPKDDSVKGKEDKLESGQRGGQSYTSNPRGGK